MSDYNFRLEIPQNKIKYLTCMVIDYRKFIERDDDALMTYLFFYFELFLFLLI